MNPVIVRNVKIGEGIPKICVPIVGVTEEEIYAAAEEIKEVPADLAEWRVDWYESAFDTEKVINVATKLRELLDEMPIIFTFRTKKEGGEQGISYKRYAELLQSVSKSGAVDIVDVEVYMDSDVAELITSLKEIGVKVIGSNHHFTSTPPKSELVTVMRHMQKAGADIPKLAVMPQSSADVLELLQATTEMKDMYADRPIVTMSMDGMGAVSRISGEVFGSAITFGTVKKASAPGQIEVHKLKEILEILHVNKAV